MEEFLTAYSGHSRLVEARIGLVEARANPKCNGHSRLVEARTGLVEARAILTHSGSGIAEGRAKPRGPVGTRVNS